MKAIYTTINNKVYRIIQDVNAPITDVKPILSNGISLTCDSSQKLVNAIFYLTDWSSVGVKTNKENATDFITYLEDEGITEINNLQDRFTVSVDYTLYNGDMKEIEHSVVIKPIKSKDFIYPLGINEENECVYRRIKQLTGSVDWIITDKLPYGIICNKSNESIIIINDVCIYQDKHEDEDVENHQSIYGQSYNCTSCTINTALENKVLVYSSKSSGFEFTPIRNKFNPRTITMDLTIDLTNLIVIYDHTTINKIITQNIAIKNGTLTTDTTDDTSTSTCNCDCCKNNTNDDTTNQSSTSGDGTGSFTQEYVWERSTQENSLSVKVVEDLYQEDEFDEETMVHKSDVIGDIPDIEVDEYVIKTTVV